MCIICHVVKIFYEYRFSKREIKYGFLSLACYKSYPSYTIIRELTVLFKLSENNPEILNVNVFKLLCCGYKKYIFFSFILM